MPYFVDESLDGDRGAESLPGLLGWSREKDVSDSTL
jgi:hypothetical protein